eukprot:GFUD01037907.1.p1 GENE.GFUD01037907.1~~GFUD01037907.1.p1  ORF type:complete len:776 (+),score=157.04 GFUD01037907.1:222-2549(+)
MGFNNAEPLPQDEAENRLKEHFPGLLLQDEKLDMGFKAIRDEYYFTSHRILVVDVHGISGKKVEYQSCPYHAIKAFAIETAGSLLDTDSSLKVYGGIAMSIEFDKDKVNIFEIQKYMSGHIFSNSVEDRRASEEAAPYKTETKAEGGKTKTMLDYLANDSVRLEEGAVENELGGIGALIPGEKVELAYKCGRDMVVCTSKRVMYMDTQGFSGKRVEFLSLRYSCIKAYEVETAGGILDRDATFNLFTNISEDRKCLRTDLRKGQSDIMEVLWYFNNKLLGADTLSKEESVPLAAASNATNTAWSWLSDDMSQIDANLVNHHFHTSQPLLQGNEVCEVAFKGRRDLVLFTNKRMLFVDVQGLSGKRVSYCTIPYTSIKMFQVATAGGGMDKDCEIGIFTEVWFIPSPPGDNPPPPEPGMSYVEFDVNKHTTDILGIFRYLAAKVYTLQDGNPGIYPDLEDLGHQLMEKPFEASPPGAMEKLMNYIGQDLSQMDPKEIEEVLSIGGASPVLDFDEKVLMAFKCGRDFTIFTSKCILDINVKGFTGKKKEFRSIPYSSIRSFSTEASGSFDRDSELKIGLNTPWEAQMKRDFSAGKSDIVSIQALIAAKTLGAPGRPSDFANDNTIKKSGEPGNMEKMIAFLGDKHLQIDPKTVEQKFKIELPILQADEDVELAYKHGRDMFVVTTKRVLNIDVQGLRGKKVEFESFPLKNITGFSVQSAGTLSRTVKARLFVSALKGAPDQVFDLKIEKEFSKKDVDIFELNNSLASKILVSAHHQM